MRATTGKLTASSTATVTSWVVPERPSNSPSMPSLLGPCLPKLAKTYLTFQCCFAASILRRMRLLLSSALLALYFCLPRLGVTLY